MSTGDTFLHIAIYQLEFFAFLMFISESLSKMENMPFYCILVVLVGVIYRCLVEVFIIKIRPSPNRQ